MAWMRRNLHPDAEPVTLDEAIKHGLDEGTSFVLREWDLLYQFNDTSTQLREAKNALVNRNYSQALDSLGEHFKYRSSPGSLVGHLQAANVSQLLNQRWKKQPVCARQVQLCVAEAQRIVCRGRECGSLRADSASVVASVSTVAPEVSVSSSGMYSALNATADAADANREKLSAVSAEPAPQDIASRPASSLTNAHSDQTDSAPSQRPTRLSSRRATYSNIDWFSDFVGHSWPHLHLNEIERRLAAGEPLGIADSENLHTTWAFNRHDQFTVLGRAYLLTGNEAYASEFVIEALSWCRDNPPLIGVNWYDPDTVATRTVNWILALGMFLESEQLRYSHWATLIGVLLIHGAMLERMLLSKPDAPRLSVATALFLLAKWLPEARNAKRWLDLANNACPLAVTAALNRDGLHHSLSWPQHYLCCEWMLLQALQHDLERMRPPTYLEYALTDALTALKSLVIPPIGLVHPGGHFPVSGFMGRWCTEAEHVISLLALGAVLLQKGELYGGLSPELELPEMLWWLGENGWSDLQATPSGQNLSRVNIYSHSGFAAVRDRREDAPSQLLFVAPPSDLLRHPQADANSSSPNIEFHTDALSFALTVNGRPFILEPGLAPSSRYYDPRLSLLHSHSAPKITDELLLPFDKDAVSKLRAKKLEIPKGTVCSELGFRQDDDKVILGSSRYAYLPNGSKVILTRHIIFHLNDQVLIIRDSLEGQGTVPYECSFLVPNSLRVMMRGDMGCRLIDRHIKARIIPSLPYKPYTRQTKGAYYTSSGRLVVANCLRYGHANLELPGYAYFVICWGNDDVAIPSPEEIDNFIDPPRRYRRG